ncbi:hypothetical protein SLITO_v1c11090 [Spiroplasma litorale]|uniref:Lipoprotein n=1 Tax=Spiroplasma litorale TaxID=216942 RepID=A0A0K1W321_9MOLU|nr:lipoprotein [Spiroplasma litorale]AKX34720.1 hypothetical protein SLITO_v1c11090 [Spiroplasma litorale]
MKKLLSILGSVTFMATSISTVVACGDKTEPEDGNSAAGGEEGKKGFVLDTKSIEGNPGDRKIILIKNYSELSNDELPNSYKCSEDGYLDVTFDYSNKQILVDLKKPTTNNIKLTISSSANYTADIDVKVNNVKIDISKVVKINTFIAGNKLSDGTIDPSIAIGDEGFKITEAGIVDSMNNINKLSLDIKGLDIKLQYSGDNGIGARYEISGKENSDYTGKVIVNLNKGVDPNLFFANKNIGNIFVYEGAFNKIDDVLKHEKNKKSIISMAIENLGATNKDFEYLRGNLLQGKDMFNPNAKVIIDNAVATKTGVTLNKFPTMNPIFVDKGKIELTYNLVKEDRITLYEALPSDKLIEAPKDLLENESIENSKKLKDVVYDKLTDEFKNKISQSYFESFTKVRYKIRKSKEDATKVTKIDVLPGSNDLYGHDGGSFNSYIVTDSTVGIGTQGGNLGEYEEDGKLDIKYTTGMGFFEYSGGLKGDFHQGHDIFKEKQ